MDQEESSGKNIKSNLGLIKKKLLNRNVAVFSFFLLLSFIFWYINALSNNITGTVDFPVRYINFPDNLALVNELPDELSLELQGPGYSVLRARISGNKTPLVIDVDNSGLSVKNNEAELDFFIRSGNLRETFIRQLRSNFEINSIKPDSIDFIFDKIMVKKVPVVADVKINLQKQYMINGKIITDPDSVEITGPGTIVDTIRSVRTEFQEFNHVDGEISRNIELLPLRKVGMSHKRTEIKVPVEQYTEEVTDVKIRILNKPDTVEVRLFPDEVSIHFNIALSDYNRMQEVTLDAVVDMKGLDARTVERLDVELLNLPDFVNNVRYNPGQVEYIIEKK